jgi:putative ABC transport system permease protein
MTEALLLALAGGVLGALIAYVLFNNFSVSTLGQNFTQVVFDFKVTPQLVARGLIIAIIIGMIGGFMPALRAARLPVTRSLREQKPARGPRERSLSAPPEAPHRRVSAAQSACTSSSG